MNILVLKKALVYFEIKKTAVILTASVILPFLVHFIPAYGGLPAGARLLPIFYASFVAIVLFKPQVSIINALFAPLLNVLLTGMPAGKIAIVLTFELLFFTVIAWTIRLRYKKFWLNAPLSYLAAKFISAKFMFWPFLKSASVALSGLGALLLINIMLLLWEEKEDGQY